MNNRKPKRIFGYIGGFVLSIISTVIAFYFLFGLAAGCLISMGCSNSSTHSGNVILLSYFFAVVSIAFIIKLLFKANFFIALVINISPVFLYIGANYFMKEVYYPYKNEREYRVELDNAKKDFENIRIGQPFVSLTSGAGNATEMILLTPFTVTSTVKATSLWYVVKMGNKDSDIKFSENESCNTFLTDTLQSQASYITDRNISVQPFTYSELYESSRSKKSLYVFGDLTPNKQYYLTRTFHFSKSACKLSDLKDFDPSAFDIHMTMPD